MGQYYRQKSYERSSKLHIVCYFLIWTIFLYSSIIQYKYFEIPKAMLILGSMLLVVFLFLINGRPFSFEGLFSRECSWFVAYQVFMLPVGILSAVSLNSHFALWVTSAQYLFFMLVLTALIKDTGTNSFEIMLIIVSILLSVYLLTSPVLYTTGRYSISLQMNPNGIGMYLTTGIWSVLYFQSKKKIPLVLSFGLIMLMLYSLLQTGSRKALIGSGLVILGWFIFCYFSSLKGYSTGKRIISFFIIILLAVILVYLFTMFFQQSILSERMTRVMTEATEGERNQLYQLGWSLFSKQPLTGYGFGGFTYFQGEHSHSTFVEILVCGGILSAIIYFIPYFVSIRKCFYLLAICNKDEKLANEALNLKMLLILWALMLFFSTCVVHPYQFLSYLIFGIIFGETVFLENKINDRHGIIEPVVLQKCKYIK